MQGTAPSSWARADPLRREHAAAGLAASFLLGAARPAAEATAESVVLGRDAAQRELRPLNLRVLLSPRAVPPQSRRYGPPPPARRGPSTLRRNCRSHGRMRVKEWLDSCGALSTNMQGAEIDHVECRSHSDLLYNARGLKCATLAHALSLSQCLHKSSSDMSRAAAAARPSLLSISAKRNPKRPLHGALVAAVTPERPSRVHGQAEENGKPENSGKTHQKSWQIEIRS